ncbi:hypothetical protein M422DRAFT_29435, partial [Sphaerobolus stellatus SS14]
MDQQTEVAPMDVTNIEGKVSPTLKRQYLKAFDFYALGYRGCFSRTIGERIVIKRVEGHVEDEQTRTIQTRAVAELRVDKDMLDINGNLHSGCIAYLLDICTSSVSFFAGLYFRERFDDKDLMERTSRAVSQSFNVQRHAPAKEGSLLKIVCYSVAMTERAITIQCQIWDQTNNVIVASGGHTLMLSTVMP